MERLLLVQKDISVYIPAYNVAEFLPRSIEGLLAQTLRPREILVIDDGSNDRTAEIASRYLEVTVVSHGRNRGLAAARNTAFRTAACDLVASLDADCMPDPEWLRYLVCHFEDAKIAGVGGRLIEGNQQALADRWRQAHMPQEWGAEAVHNPRFLFGCNNMFRKSAVLDAGGYDEAMRTNGEDADMSGKLRQRGWNLLYDPEALAVHLRHDSIRSILETYWRWWRFGVKAYANGVTLRSVVGHALFVHFRHSFLELARRDLRAGRLDLFGVDLVALGYLPYRDFQLWIESLPKSASRRASSEV